MFCAGFFLILFFAFSKDIDGISTMKYFVYIVLLWQKGGEIMRTSSFEYIVRLQFNALMMIAIKGTLSSHRRQIARRSKHEVLFCELPEMKQIEHGMNDSYSHEFVSFQVLDFVIRISDQKLSTASKE